MSEPQAEWNEKCVVSEPQAEWNEKCAVSEPEASCKNDYLRAE